MPLSDWWQPYLPIVVIGVVLLIRMRRINRARRMHLWRLLVAPIVVGVLAIYLFVSIPPNATGVAMFAGGLAVGAAIGWQRARWMTISFDPASGMFMVKQSPLAVALLIGVMLARRILLPQIAMQGGSGHAPHAIWIIDGAIGLGLGSVVAQNIELWLRARTVRAAMTAGVFG